MLHSAVKCGWPHTWVPLGDGMMVLLVPSHSGKCACLIMVLRFLDEHLVVLCEST